MIDFFIYTYISSTNVVFFHLTAIVVNFKFFGWCACNILFVHVYALKLPRIMHWPGQTNIFKLIVVMHDAIFFEAKKKCHNVFQCVFVCMCWKMVDIDIDLLTCGLLNSVLKPAIYPLFFGLSNASTHIILILRSFFFHFDSPKLAFIHENRLTNFFCYKRHCEKNIHRY